MDKRDFDYNLPSQQIATHPPTQRRDARLLCLDRDTGALSDQTFAELPDQLTAGDVLVFNDTRVIPARLFGHKQSGGRVEILIEQILGQHQASAKIRANRAPTIGSRIQVGAAELMVAARDGELFTLETESSQPIAELVEHAGHTPLPPYIQRPDTADDRVRYQSVWARHDGAVAAPTASLHFDHALLTELAARGIETATVTLHVGAGTYQALRDGDIHTQRLHSERLSVDAHTCQTIDAARARSNRVVAIGTTVVRALETAAHAAPTDATIAPYNGETELFVKPGDTFHVTDAMLTNFHEPQSSLLMLVAAFAGHETVLNAYHHALAHDYRFLSYGDAMWIA
ncbi:tRNA preQ1(34) S-adenosylmethionine ribosyltransferase-isomerase QueA [Salinisphaera sp. USBA-960]|nr:tRNA preQ1(34) S-adenosylmethionine ribosyltransferase-isomerase QueA [Salifodinibacter halophilus]NNC27151.1 tRNA preQ1(34) S-adenosylmethionine ribosyltransferase-isomerase QueA [Salifodinibacter halophilus]